MIEEVHCTAKESVWLPLIHHFLSQAVGEQWIQQELEKDAGAVFKMGFHSIPSMHQLHLHVISQVRPAVQNARPCFQYFWNKTGILAMLPNSGNQP